MTLTKRGIHQHHIESHLTGIDKGKAVSSIVGEELPLEPFAITHLFGVLL